MDVFLLDGLDSKKLLLTVYISATDKQVWKVVMRVAHHLVIVEGSYLCEGRI